MVCCVGRVIRRVSPCRIEMITGQKPYLFEQYSMWSESKTRKEPTQAVPLVARLLSGGLRDTIHRNKVLEFSGAMILPCCPSQPCLSGALDLLKGILEWDSRNGAK